MQDSLKRLPETVVAIDNVLEGGDLFSILQKLVIAILIGLLIGLEREHSKPEQEKTFAGIRTYPLIAVLGFVAALVSTLTSYWVYVVVFAAYASLITTAHIFASKEGHMGGTSEISTLLTFILGSLVFWNLIIFAAIIAVIVTLFLTLKIQFHSFVGKISEEDLYATLKLAIITIIVLPILPDRTYGPLDVLNPRMIWMMVIFISSISFAGYILIKFFGKDKGIPISGLMGGMVSSTAVAVSFSRKSKESEKLSGNFAVGVILASTIMYIRVFIVVAVVKSGLIPLIWIPLLALTISGLVISYILNKKIKNGRHEKFEMKNPFELKSALLFGAVFGVVIFVSKAAEIYLGSGGVYAASALAGITSVDAIVISLSLGDLSAEIVIAAILLATITNNLVKGIITMIQGTKEMSRKTNIGLGLLSILTLLYLGYLFI